MTIDFEISFSKSLLSSIEGNRLTTKEKLVLSSYSLNPGESVCFNLLDIAQLSETFEVVINDYFKLTISKK